MTDDYLTERLDDYHRLRELLPRLVRQRFPVGTVVRIPAGYRCGEYGTVDHYHGTDPDVVVVRAAAEAGAEPRYPFVLAGDLLRVNPSPKGGA